MDRSGGGQDINKNLHFQSFYHPPFLVGGKEVEYLKVKMPELVSLAIVLTYVDHGM